MVLQTSESPVQSLSQHLHRNPKSLGSNKTNQIASINSSSLIYSKVKSTETIWFKRAHKEENRAFLQTKNSLQFKYFLVPLNTTKAVQFQCSSHSQSHHSSQVQLPVAVALLSPVWTGDLKELHDDSFRHMQLETDPYCLDARTNPNSQHPGMVNFTSTPHPLLESCELLGEAAIIFTLTC